MNQRKRNILDAIGRAKKGLDLINEMNNPIYMKRCLAQMEETLIDIVNANFKPQVNEINGRCFVCDRPSGLCDC